MDLTAIPSDAESHHRTKWSRDLYIYIDDDVVSPSIFVFDRNGKQVYNSLLQIPGVDRMRVEDFESAPDHTLWLCGNSHSPSGQASYFLAHITNDGQDVHFVQTAPYHANQISVAPDGTVWSAGFELVPGAPHDSNDRAKLNDNADTLRHYDGGGKLLASAVPTTAVGDKIRIVNGVLRATQDRVGWYATNANYMEFSPDLKVQTSFPPAPAISQRHKVEGFVLTPSGKSFLVVTHSSPTGRVATLYQLDQVTRAWVEIDSHQLGFDVLPMLQGNDGESLVFMGPPDKSKLQIINISSTVTNQ